MLRQSGEVASRLKAGLKLLQALNTTAQVTLAAMPPPLVLSS